MVTKCVIRPSGLLPYLVGGAMIVRQPVGVVGILVCIKILVGMLRHDLARLDDRAVGALGRIGVDNLSPVSLENSLAFDRDIGRHAQSHAKTAGCAQHGVGDSGVSAGRIKQALAAVHLAAAEGFLHDVGRRAVLHRAAGIRPFGLAVNLGVRHIGANTLQSQQRRVANPLDDRESHSRNR